MDTQRWGHLQVGDVVRADGERGRFVVKSFRLDTLGECRWVSVFGGPENYRQWRSFVPGKLHKCRKATAERAS